MSGPITAAKDAFSSMLANSAGFQALVGVETSVDAAKRIYSRGLPPPANAMRYTLDELAALRPFAILYFPDRDPYVARRTAHMAWGEAGRVEAYFEVAIDPSNANDPAAAEAALTDLLGGVVSDLKAAAGQAGALNLTEIAVGVRPMRCSEKERGSEGDHFFTILAVAWHGGIEG